MTTAATTLGAVASAPARRALYVFRPDRAVLVLAWAAALVLTLLYAALSLRRHARFETSGYDLGIFEQGVRAYADGRLPTSLLKGVDYPLLGDHFSPIIALLGPVYALVPGPGTLLVAQAVLLAVGVVPLMLWAGRALGATSTMVVGAAYGLAGGLAHAVAFDFHEIAFAVPLLAFSLSALGRRRMLAAALWAAPLVLVKEDLGLTVGAVGGVILLLGWRGSVRDRLVGLATVAFGIGATLLETTALIPAANPLGANAYTGQVTLPTALEQLSGLLTNELKISTLVVLLLPTAFFALRSPLALVAVPTLAWRFLSDNPNYWGTAFHYDAVLVPIVTAALVDVLARTPATTSAQRTRRRLFLITSAIATAALLVQSPLARLLSPDLWREPAHALAAEAVLDRIPSGASVAASNSLAPHLTDRADVSLLGILPVEAIAPEYVVADTSLPSQWPVSGDRLDSLLTQAARSGYRMVAEECGITLLRWDDRDR